MRANRIIGICLLLLAVTQPSVAQDNASPEAYATVKQGERATLDRGSIAEVGTGRRRFEVAINWDASAGARPGGHMARTVRYLADCEAATLTLVAVGVFDPGGQLAKSIVVPPGAGDPVKPSAGTDEAKWLREVCR